MLVLRARANYRTKILLSKTHKRMKTLTDTLPMGKLAQTNELISVDNVAINWQT